MTIRVLLVDDHAVVRHGLTELLSADGDIEVVGTAADGAAAVSLVDELSPDVVLMDLSMPDVDGIEATRRIAASGSTAQVVVLTSFVDRQRILDALAAGAVGYILKDAAADEVTAAVHTAAAGGSPLDPKVARVVLQTHRSSRPEAELSAREKEVLALVAQGLANKNIARRLGIAERTVKAHLTHIFQTISVSDRTQAALWAREHLRPGDGTAP